MNHYFYFNNLTRDAMYLGLTDYLKSPKAKNDRVMNCSFTSSSGSVKKYFLSLFS